MCVQKWLHPAKLILFSAAFLLFGCADNDFKTGALAGKSSRHHHYRHSANAASDPNNAAIEDYFSKQSAAALNDRNNLWAAIRENLQINHYPHRPEVNAQIAWFVQHQGYLNRTARRAAPFMYYIHQEVKAHNLPSELVLLPMLESAYNPFLASSAGAAGLWQLIPGTARTFGVRQDWWYDGRRDIAASTKAALDYLSYLRNYFGGDWLLAIAAYDSGEGTVTSAIRRNARVGAGTDFWSLHLPRETEAYVPRLLALAIIINNPRAYGIELPPISNTPYLGQVEIGSQITLDQAAQMAGVSLTELKILNPCYKQNTLSPHQPYKLLLPIDCIANFKHNLLNGSPTTHNESMPESTDNEAAAAAALLTNSSNTGNAEKPPLIAPPNLSEAANLDKAAMPVKETKTQNNAVDIGKRSDSNDRPHLYKITHTVKIGETLESIAQLYKISAIELARWNHLSSHAHLKPKSQLIIFLKEHKPQKHPATTPTKHKNSHKIAAHTHNHAHSR